MDEEPILRETGDGRLEQVPDRPRSKAELLAEAALAVPHLVILLARLMADHDVPRRRKVVAAGALVYVISPIDLLPDAIPFIGRVDDVVFTAAAIHYLIRSVPDEKVRRYWEGSDDALDIVAGIVEWGSELIPGPLRNLLSS